MSRDLVARIKAAAVDEKLREAARERWGSLAPSLFSHQPRTGIRVSDAGACRRALWHEIHVAPKVFSPEVQLFALDDGTLGGAWFACLLAASLEAEGYYVELEPEVEHDGTPGHIDLYYSFQHEANDHDRGVVEFKRTAKSRTLKPPDGRARWQCLQSAKYSAAKGVEDFAIVTIGPASTEGMRCDWYTVSDWAEEVIEEYDRLSAALGPVEPAEDVKPGETFRCDGCPVVACIKNPNFSGETRNILVDLDRSIKELQA